MSLIDDIKAVAKEDADLSEIEGQIGGYINSSELTKDNFIEIAKKHPNLMSAHDSLVSKSVEAGVNNFKEKGMVDILKEKENSIRAEVNPKETPEQKEIRELKEWKLQSINDAKLSTLKDELSSKAKELGFDPIKARDYSVYGDNATAKLEADATWFNSELESRLSTEIKDKYSKTAPRSTVLPLADLDSKIKEARAAGNAGLALKLQQMKDRQKKPA